MTIPKNQCLRLIVLLFGVTLSPLRAQSTYEQRHDAYFDDISTRGINTGQHDGPHRAGRTGFWTTQGKLQRGNESTGVWNNLISTIADADGSADAGGANGGFSGWPGMDIYLRWQHRLPQNVKDAYYTEYTTMPNYGKGSTPNQRIMWAAACKLACETWGTSTVTQFSNAANRYGDPTGKAYMMAICDRTVKYNFEERWAKHYLEYTLGPLRSIADLSNDPELVNKARMTWNWGWMDIASFSFKGRWAIPAGRGSMTQDGNSSDISEFGSWLMFEGSPRANMLDADQCLPYTQPKVGQANLVTQPPILPEMLEAATDRSKPFTRRGMARVHETQFATSHITRDWALYSQLEADTTLNADGTLKIKDLENNGVPSNDWSSERWAVLWDETGAAGLTMKAPTGYGWCPGCGLGPHEDIVQHDGTIAGIYNIPTTWTWQYTNDSIPTNVTAVIDESATTGRLFLHYGKILIAITRSDIGNFTWPPAAQTFCNKRGYAIECASLSEYPQSTAAARLAAFKADIDVHPPDFSHVNDAVPRMIYTTRDGTMLDITYGLGGKINNDPVDYEGWPLNESPWSYQSQMGNMWVFGKDRTLLWNYKNWTESENNRPTPLTTSSLTTSSGAPVEVDLSTRVTDSRTPAANLKYRITSTTHGTAEILADGITARFLPAANSAGSAGFTFTAGDAFPDHRAVFLYDYEQADPVTGGKTTDQSSNDRYATASVSGLAAATGDASVAAPLAPHSTRSLRLTTSGTGSAKLSLQVNPATLNFSKSDWTFATWFKRESFKDDDFIFHIGTGGGFGGDGDELQLYLPAQSRTIAVRHYNAANSLDVNLSSPADVDIGRWHHVALQFDKKTNNSGDLKIFIDGVLSATAPDITWNLPQTGAITIGGPARNNVLSRNFSGWLDDTVLYRGEIPAAQIAELATGTAAHLGGLKLTQTVTVETSPLAPATLTGTAGANVVNLTWTPSAGAGSYTVKSSATAAGPFALLASGITGISFSDAAADFGVSRFYTVSASNAAGESAPSNVVSVTLPATDPTIWAGGTMNAWSRGARIGFPGYTRDETLSDIPLLVTLGPATIPGFNSSQFAFSNGADLRFTDSSGTTELSYEIEKWDPSGTSYLWVRVPALSRGVAVNAFWGNPAATASALPGSLAGLAMWLKADAITGLADGQTVTTWSDSSGNARNATLLGGTPLLKTNALNGRPVVRFTPDGESGFSFPQMSNIRTVFWVVKETTAATHFLLGDDNNYHFHRGAAGVSIWDATYASANVKSGTTRLNGVTVNGTTTALGSGYKLVSLVTAGNVEASRLCKDRAIAARSWDGDVAEVIVYDRALSANEELLVGSYLAGKYALTTSYAGAAPVYTSDGSVWDNGHTGVWHLNAAPPVDSTSLPQPQLANTATIGSGRIYNGYGYSGSSQESSFTHASELNLVNNYEISGWFKLAATDKPAANDYRTLTTKETDSGTRNWWLSINNAGRLWWKSSAGIDITSPADLADNQWHHYSAVHDGSVARLYIDGIQAGTDAAPASEATTTYAVRIGSENGTRFWKGSLDEFRVSNTSRSAAWVKTVYDNINGQSAFQRIAPAATFTTAFAPMVTTLSATGIGSTTATLNGNLSATGGSATNVTLYWGPTDGGGTPANWAHSAALGSRGTGGFNTHITGLSAGGTYHFRAFAENASGSTWAADTQTFISAPAAPAAPTATPADGFVQLTWTAASGASAYNLKRSTTSAGPYTILLANIIGTAFTDSTASPRTTWHYAVSAVGPGGESPNSPPVSVIAVEPPSGLTATAGNSSVALAWLPAPGATGYIVKRANAPAGPFTAIASNLNSSGYNDTTATNGTEWFYLVTATTTGFESASSPVVSATPVAAMVAPTGLAGTPANNGATLTWNPVALATSYKINRSAVSGGPYTTIASGLLAPFFNDGGLNNGTAYFYVVTAVNGTIESPPSSEIHVTPAVQPSVFTTASAGNWSAATWSPQMPISAFETIIVLNNAAAISSAANLGSILANKLNLTNAAVTLTGDPVFLAGTAPGITTSANFAHSIANNLTLDAATTFSIASNTTTVSGSLGGNGGITKTGAGTLVLSGSNTHAGATTVSTGILNLRNPLALGSSASATIASGAVLELQGGIAISGKRVTLNGSGSNGALKNISGNNTWSGDITAAAVSGVTRIGSDAGTLALTGEINQDTASSDQLVFQGNGHIVITGIIDGGSRLVRGNTGTGVISLLGENTYTGRTSINGGILEVDSISSLVGQTGDEEVALTGSSLGVPDTVANGTIDIGYTSTPATLRFIGPRIKTDRVVNLAGTSGGATIEQNGSGLLTFLSPFTATGAGAKTLTLTGTGEGLVSGAIPDSSGTEKTSLVKNGPGTWTLGGANTYTGNTSITAGTLVLNGTIPAGGSLSVAAGATLSGSGTIAPVTTVTGNIAPGRGTLTFGSSLTFGAVSRIKWSLEENSAIDSRQISVPAASVITSAAVDVKLNGPDSLANFTHVFWATPQSWSVLTTAARTGNFTLGTVSTDSTGQPASTFGAFSIQQTSTTVNLVWTPAPGIEQWRLTYFGTTTSTGSAADTFDPDGDGIANLLEWALDLNPTLPSTVPATLIKNGSLLEYTHTHRKDSGVTLQVEWSDTLTADWSVAGVIADPPVSVDTVHESIRVTVPTGPNARRFLHLKATNP